MKKAWAWFKTNWNVVLDSILWGGATTGIFLLGWAALIQVFKKNYESNEWLVLGCTAAMVVCFSYGVYKFFKKPEASMIVYAKNIIWKKLDDQNMDVELKNDSTDKKEIEDDKKN